MFRFAKYFLATWAVICPLAVAWPAAAPAAEQRLAYGHKLGPYYTYGDARRAEWKARSQGYATQICREGRAYYVYAWRARG